MTTFSGPILNIAVGAYSSAMNHVNDGNRERGFEMLTSSFPCMPRTVINALLDKKVTPTFDNLGNRMNVEMP